MLTKVYKMGNKIGVYISTNTHFYKMYDKGDPLLLTISRNSKKVSFITRFNYNMVIRRSIRDILKLKCKDKINVTINKIKNLKRAVNLFHKDKIDLLYLIPKRTNLSYEILVSKFIRNNEEWLRIWYSHNKGSGRQLELRRYLDIEKFGSLLGQYQAEGTKNSKIRLSLEFCNKLAEEHQDFISYLEEIGLSKTNLSVDVMYHKDIKDINKKIRNFEEKTLIKVKHRTRYSTGKRGLGFKTYMRNVLLLDIILNSLKIIKQHLINKRLDKRYRILADNFFAKVLTGDGTLDICPNKIVAPYIRLNITDGNLKYLEEYKRLMHKLDFKPKIIKKSMMVRTKVNFNNLLYLYKINAFKHTNNWNKIIAVMNIYFKKKNFYMKNYPSDNWDNQIKKLKEERQIFDSYKLLDSLNVKFR